MTEQRAQRHHSESVRQEASEALRAQLRDAIAGQRAWESRFHSIIERAADGIVIVDGSGNVGYVNPAAEQLFGRSGDELIGQPFGHAVFSGETTEIDLVRRDGAALVVELRSSETTWDGDAAQIVSLRDITDRREAEERAQRLELANAAREVAERASERWRFLAEAGETLDASLDPDETLASLARLIVPRVAEWCVIDLVDGDRLRRVATVHADPDRQSLLDALKEVDLPDDRDRPALRVMRTRVAELHRNVSDAQLRAWATDAEHAALLRTIGIRSVMSVPMLTRSRCVGVISMVCEEREYDENDLALAREVGTRAARALENAQLHEAALVASKAKSDFLTVMSHELRTPLNAILGYAQLLNEGVTGDIDEAQRDQIRRIQASAMHLLHVINDILLFASMEAAREQVAPVDAGVQQLVDDVLVMVEPLLREKGLALRVNVPDPSARFFTDAAKVRQIVLNLLTNAIKFTDSGHVEVKAALEGEELVITVIDTGRGIASTQLRRIFEPFWQAEGPLTRFAGGTGLGLAISQRLAQLLGGRVEAQSEPGRGSSFALRVPARVSASAAH